MNDSIAIIGGGAAGFFGAIACAGALRETGAGARILIFESARSPLAKVRISGGGRCNVTNACQDPAELVKAYPRGSRELRGPLTRFGPRETVAWFEAHGVKLKTEPDGRMFPETDDSRTIVNCLRDAASELGVELRTGMLVRALHREEDGGFTLTLGNGERHRFDRVLLATGGARPALKLAEDVGHSIEAPVPSLFTFKISDKRLEGLSGLSFEQTRVRLYAGNAKPLEETGPLLVTHWGLSGPAVLRLSAWGARALHETSYRARLVICFIPGETEGSLSEWIRTEKDAYPKRTIRKYPHRLVPRRFWERLCAAAGISNTLVWAEISKKQMRTLARELSAGEYEVAGKGQFKDEFVTCGGVRLKEVDFRSMESKQVPGLYLAGEVLDLDAITGGYNFQAAWTTGWIAGEAIARSVLDK